MEVVPHGGLRRKCPDGNWRELCKPVGWARLSLAWQTPGFPGLMRPQ